MAKKDDIFKKQSETSSSILMHKEVQKELIVVVCSSEMSDSVIANWADKLWKFQEAYAKILYSELSSFILDEKKDEIIQTVRDNLSKISAFMDNEYLNGKIEIDSYRFWLKYRDHCELAILQRKHYHISVGEIEEKAKSTALESVKQETDRIQKDLTSQLIGLVSIFTALSFVVFGGINILSSVLENVKLASITRLVCTGLLWTLCMSILFYIFVRFILKIMKPKEQGQVLSKQFMRSFWILITVLVALFAGTVVFDFLNSQNHQKGGNSNNAIQPQEIIIHDFN